VDARAFLKKVIVFAISLVPMYFLLHELIYETHHWVRTQNDPDAVYVIGNSRAYHSVDVSALRRATGRPVYSWAQPAMSAYSALKVAEMVPPGATVLFAPSWGMVLRDGKEASFRSGYSLRGLSLLLGGTGEYRHLRRIFVINRSPVEAPLLQKTPPLEDSLTRDMRKLDAVRAYYLGPRPEYFETNLKLLSEAARILLEKGCKLEVIAVPVPDEVEEVRNQSYGSIMNAIDLAHPNACIHPKIDLEPGERNIWKDADHMNSIGRRLMTGYLIEHVLDPHRTRPEPLIADRND
jgi:hypothetical protein